MSKFIISLNTQSIAKQIAILLNSNNKLKQHYTSSKILAGNTQYLLELGGYNEKHADMERKVIGIIGTVFMSKDVVLIKHLCVHSKYRNKGIATSLLKQVIATNCTKCLQMRVRSDNISSLNLAERFGFVYIYHETISNYHVLILGRENCV